MGYDGRRAIFVKNITVPQPYSMALDGIQGRPSSQRALSPRSGVSNPTRRYTAPSKRTVSPSITSMIWPDGLTLLHCHIIHAAMAAAPSAIAASTPRAKGTRGYLDRRRNGITG